MPRKKDLDKLCEEILGKRYENLEQMVSHFMSKNGDLEQLK